MCNTITSTTVAQKPTLLISACLLGVRCRYDGQSRGLSEKIIQQLREQYELVPVCPEILGGLPTPRVPSEICGDRVVNQKGADVTDAYQRGADETLRLAKLFSASRALLKARSPACGFGEIHNGTFTGKLCKGNGICAARLAANGIQIWSEETWHRLIYQSND